MAHGNIYTNFKCIRCSREHNIFGDSVGKVPSGWQVVALTISQDEYLFCPSCINDFKTFIFHPSLKKLEEVTNGNS